MLVCFLKCEMNNLEFIVIVVVIVVRGMKILFIIICILVNVFIFGNIFF